MNSRNNSFLAEGLSHLRADRQAEALPLLQKALKKDRRNGELYALVAGLLFGKEDIPASLAMFAKGYELAPSEKASRQVARRMAYILSTYSLDQTGVISPVILRKLFAEPEIDHQTLMGPALSVLRHDGPWKSVFRSDADAAADILSSNRGKSALASQLMNSCLRGGILVDRDLEMRLTAFRRKLLLEGTYQSRELTGFLTSLACQMWLNEYAWFETEEESERIEQVMQTPDSGETLLIAALYRDPGNFDPAHAGSLPQDVAELTVSTPRKEEAVAAEIPTLGGSMDETSLGVQEQYEENPYPAWASVTLGDDGERKNMVARLSALNTSPDRSLDILIAGCGTGRQAAMAARAYGSDSNVLAFDLSRRSLAHAKLNCDRLGFTNLQFAQADILKVSAEDCGPFDVIECIGVLHHLADPIDGWRKLTGLLKPGGLMNIGLYRAGGREHCRLGRDEVTAMGLSPTSSDIRRYRHHVLSDMDKPFHGTLVGNRDFCSVSGCRDLLFHVQERNYTIPEIAEALSDVGLAFLEFQLPGVYLQAFRRRFPGGESDLANWETFEQEDNRGFDAMYRFWCRKPI